MPARLSLDIWIALAIAGRREISDRVARRLHRFTLTQPIISFTFDDFPQNAATIGGGILKEFGVTATLLFVIGIDWNVVADRSNCERDDLRDLINSGHEFGMPHF